MSHATLDSDHRDSDRIDHRIRGWCAHDSTRTAIIDDAGSITTFGELMTSADTVADNLWRHGVLPGDLVCLELDRGPELIAVLLGVLVAGAHYCALDPSWPHLRLRGAVRHLTPTAHVTDTTYATPDLPDEPGRPPRLHPIDLLRHTAQSNEAPSTPSLAASREAAVFYTSGSSGRPKAVVSTHVAITRLVGDPAMPMGSRMLQTAPSSWDAFALEVWIPLMSGAAVQVHSHGPLDVGVVRRAVADGVDTVFLTTTVFNALVAEDPDALAGIETVYTGGERARGDLVIAAAQRNPHTRFINGYGPAESTIFATVHHVKADCDAFDLPIGNAVRGTEFAIVDTELRPVASGTTGQIVLYGTGLATGYRNDDDLTMQAFGRFGADHRRGYLTGDLGHLDPNGELMFDGRMDRQLKVRGVRVEPGEVERVIEQLDAVVAVAVVLPEPDRLTAFVCTGHDGGPEPLELTKLVVGHVATHLPPAFVPVAVVHVPAVPRTATGKRDVDALIELARVRNSIARELPVPASFAEFADLLPAGISGEDDIFAAGATSLTAIRIASRLTRCRGGAIAATDVISARTPDAIAGLTVTAPDDHPRQIRSHVTSSTRWMAGIPLPQWRFWFSEVKNPGNGDGIDPFVFRLSGDLDLEACSAAFDDVVGWHEALRTRLIRHGARGVRDEIANPESAVDLLEVQRVSAIDESHADVKHITSAAFDLAVDLPIRGLLQTTTGADHLLAIVAHHSAFDGWSAGVLLDDLSFAYRHRSLGETPPHREPSSYRDVWSAQDRAVRADDETDLIAWGHELLGVPDLPLLPADSVTSSATTSELWVEIPDLVRAGLARGSVIAATTPNALMLAAWARTIRTVTGCDDFAIGIPVSGRSSAAAATTIGCFVNATAVRFRAEVDAGPLADLDQSMRGLSKALRFQVMPIEQLMRLDPDRPRHRMPFCQAGFVTQDDENLTLSLGSVQADFRYPVRRDSAFELTLEVWTGERARARIWRRDDVLCTVTMGGLRDVWLTELSSIIDDIDDIEEPGTRVYR